MFPDTLTGAVPRESAADDAVTELQLPPDDLDVVAAGLAEGQTDCPKDYCPKDYCAKAYQS
jgi:hypothetical protein